MHIRVYVVCLDHCENYRPGERLKLETEDPLKAIQEMEIVQDRDHYGVVRLR